MSRKCDLTGTAKQKGNKVSHSNIKTIKHSKPNLRKVRVIENGTRKTLTVTMKAYKTLKQGKFANIVLAKQPTQTEEK